MRSSLLIGVTAALTLTFVDRTAEACGCFAPPDPTVPVVQAGEQIVFSHDNGTITAHIQIQYEGQAAEFGWLLPLPSVPEMELGTEELFAQLINSTQPRYRLNRVFGDSCVLPPFSAAPDRDNATQDPSAGNESVVVRQDSIGPFDFAVLRADTRDEMFNWLVDNNYFIPVGTEDVVGPYIHEGAYFLALKLRKGNDVGDIQPVVLRYQSDLPMIPIILTSVAANPDMGIRVWVLGEYRAIPRNYRHTVINEEYINWFNAGANYNDVVIAATNEAKDGQSFVTEYAGSTDRMKQVLNWEGRFGERTVFEGLNDPGEYTLALRNRGFTWSSNLVSALKSAIPMPVRLEESGVTEDEFYASIDYYLGFFRNDNPELFEGYEPGFDPVSLTDTLWERVVVPTLAAGALFDDNVKMTRLYTTLSPEEMTRDPVFSFNPDLPDVSNEHDATFTTLCDAQGNFGAEGILELPDGRRFYVEDQQGWLQRNRVDVPYSLRIEALYEEGAPLVEIDNTPRVSVSEDLRDGCGCTATESTASPAGAGVWFGLMILGAFGFTRRRR